MDDEKKKADNVDENPRSTDSTAGMEITLSESEGGAELLEREDSISEPVSIKDSSILEMEVDDSNTGDTITSNPEIDLGSAAAAATAVIMEDTDKIEESDSLICVSAVTDTPDSPTEGDEESFPSSENVKVELSPVSAELATRSNSALNETNEDEINNSTIEKSSPEVDTPAEPTELMDATEDLPFVIEPQKADDLETEEHTSGMEVEQDFNNESDSALEGDQGFLHEEESLVSMPDDLVETDKENNGDIIHDEDNDDDEEETYLEITRRRISQDREGNCYWYGLFCFYDL